MKSRSRLSESGFTIVELLIVIIVIGILASLVLVAYGSVTTQTRSAKITNDLNALRDAIAVARINTGKTLIQIDGSSFTGNPCFTKPTGTDLAALPKTDACWTGYNSALSAIAAASSASNIQGMTDPWGRPYHIDENEGYSGSTDCTKDLLASYTMPFVGYSINASTIVNVPNSLPGC